MMKRSDEYRVQINETTGKIDYTDNDEPKCEIQLPYAMKMLLQELQKNVYHSSDCNRQCNFKQTGVSIFSETVGILLIIFLR